MSFGIYPLPLGLEGGSLNYLGPKHGAENKQKPGYRSSGRFRKVSGRVTGSKRHPKTQVAKSPQFRKVPEGFRKGYRKQTQKPAVPEGPGRFPEEKPEAFPFLHFWVQFRF